MSTVILASCELNGQSAKCFGSGGFWGSSPAVFAIDSKILVSDSILRGGAGASYIPLSCDPSPAVSLTRGSLQVCGGLLTPGTGPGTPALPVEGDGQVFFEQGLGRCADIPDMTCTEILLPCVISGAATRGNPLPIRELRGIA